MKKIILILTILIPLKVCSQIESYQCEDDSTIFMPFNTTSEDRNYHNNHQQYKKRCYINNTGYTQYIYNSDNFNNWTDINFVAQYGDIHIKKNINHTENKNIKYQTTDGYKIYVDKLSSLERNTNIFIDGEVYFDHVNINADSIDNIAVVYFTERSKFSFTFFPTYVITNDDIVTDTIINTHTSGASSKFIHFRKIPSIVTNLVATNIKFMQNSVVWDVIGNNIEKVIIECSVDALNFTTHATTINTTGAIPVNDKFDFYRLKVITNNGTTYLSNIIRYNNPNQNIKPIKYIDIAGRVYDNEVNIPNNTVYIVLYNNNTHVKKLK